MTENLQNKLFTYDNFKKQMLVFFQFEERILTMCANIRVSLLKLGFSSLIEVTVSKIKLWNIKIPNSVDRKHFILVNRNM